MGYKLIEEIPLQDLLVEVGQFLPQVTLPRLVALVHENHHQVLVLNCSDTGFFTWIADKVDNFINVPFLYSLLRLVKSQPF